jgi:hypothetical protein
MYQGNSSLALDPTLKNWTDPKSAFYTVVVDIRKQPALELKMLIGNQALLQINSH